MQGLLDAPRQGLTTAQVGGLIGNTTGITYDFGVALLDQSDQYVRDLDTVLRTGAQVRRKMADTVHGQCSLQIEEALQWGVDRVQPYMLLSAPGYPTARFNQGVFILTSPSVDVNQTTPVWPVTGWDKVYLLTSPLADSYTVPKGANILATVTSLIAAAGGGANVRLDGTKSAAVASADMTYPLGTSQTWRYVDIINDVLGSIAYRGIWADQDGWYRSEPLIPPAQRAPEFILGDGDTMLDRYIDPTHFYHSIVSAAPKIVTRDRWAVPNWWRFIQNGLTFSPIEGSGQYTVTDLDSATGSNTTGMIMRKPVFLDATDQANLVTQGDLIVAADKNVAETIVLPTAPLPICGHADVMLYSNPRLPDGLTVRKVIADGWTLNLDGSDMSWDLTTVSAY